MKTLIILAFMMLLLACGEAPVEEDIPPADIPVDTLVPVDSIGVLMGDSCYMFGEIMDYEAVAGGGTAVLDRITGRVSVFDPDGGFVRTFGGLGEGPGQFQYPVRLAELNTGMMLVAEMMQGTVSLFDSAGIFLDRWNMGSMGMFELEFMPFDDTSFVSYNFDMVMEETSYHIRFSLWRFHALTGEVLTEYFTWTGESNPSTDFIPAYLSSATDGNGRLYVSRAGSDRWMVEVYGEGTQPLDTLLMFEGRQRAAVASDSSSIPGAWPVTYMFSADGENFDRQSTNMPLDHPFIGGLAVDGDGNLWARRGGEPPAVWDVVSPAGEHLMEVHVLAGDTTTYFDIHLNPHGVVGYVYGSEDYPRVYTMGFSR
jgi:hypothetical protein